MPTFSFPNKKFRENLGPIIKREIEKGKYIKEDDPFYLEHVKKVRRVINKQFWF